MFALKKKSQILLVSGNGVHSVTYLILTASVLILHSWEMRKDGLPTFDMWN